MRITQKAWRLLCRLFISIFGKQMYKKKNVREMWWQNDFTQLDYDFCVLFFLSRIFVIICLRSISSMSQQTPRTIEAFNWIRDNWRTMASTQTEADVCFSFSREIYVSFQFCIRNMEFFDIDCAAMAPWNLSKLYYYYYLSYPIWTVRYQILREKVRKIPIW